MKMKRSLIALAVSGAASAAMVAPASAGDVVAYGQAQVEIASVSQQSEAPGCATAAPNAETVANGCDGLTTVDNARGRIGLKATEDLGNGWKGLAKFESKADTAGGGIATGARETMVGLKGSAVTIELGNLKQAYKYTGGVKYDPFVATTLEARGNGGMSGKPGGAAAGLGHSSFVKRHLGVSGGSGPVKFRLTYGASSGDGSMTASVMFKQGGIEAFAAMADSGDLLDTNNPAGGNSYSATKLGGAFTTGPHKIKLQYETIDEDDGSDPTILFLGYEMKMGKNVIVVQLGQFDGDTATGAPSEDMDYLTVGVIHKFTKQTRVFGGIRQTDADANDREDVISVGLRKDF